MKTKSSHERADDHISNNVTYQRCLYAYEYALPLVKGKDVVDVGCGLAYGTALMAREAAHITGLDYDPATIEANKHQYRNVTNMSFKASQVPPLNMPDSSADVITAFQFIEHIEKRKEFVADCLRVLRPGGKLIVTTPNAKKSLARNPFHVHEYTFAEMQEEMSALTPHIALQGLQGNEVVNNYYAENGKWVRSILKWDVLKLHTLIPAKLLTGPYNWITSLMRRNLMEKVDTTTDITTSDFNLQSNDLDETWDIYAIIGKP